MKTVSLGRLLGKEMDILICPDDLCALAVAVERGNAHRGVYDNASPKPTKLEQATKDHDADVRSPRRFGAGVAPCHDLRDHTRVVPDGEWGFAPLR